MESLEKVLLIAVGVIILFSFLSWIIPNFNQIGEFMVDNDSPIWDKDHVPKDQVIKYGENFLYGIKASDISGIDHYWISDTSNFHIGNDVSFKNIGIIVNATILNVGNYRLEIRAYDPSDNFISANITITVEN